MAEKWPNFFEVYESHENLDYIAEIDSSIYVLMNSSFLWQESWLTSFWERIMCAAECFRQRPNFLVDLAEIICQELATLVKS
jgi:hypothetical protein